MVMVARKVEPRAVALHGDRDEVLCHPKVPWVDISQGSTDDGSACKSELRCNDSTREVAYGKGFDRANPCLVRVTVANELPDRMPCEVGH